MNTVLKVIQERVACRSFTGEAIEQEKLEAIIKAGLQAPSAMNEQPWKLVVITNKKLLEEMDEASMYHFKSMEDTFWYDRMMSRGGKLFYNAPCLILVVKKPNKELDCGIVCENIALAATSLGIGNVICGLAITPFKTEKKDQYRKRFIPKGYEFGMGVLLGIPTDPNGTPHHIDLSKVIYVKE